MTGFLRSRFHSFGHAFRGWWYVLRTQRNAWIHVVVTAIIFVLSFWLRLDARDWAVIVLATGMVFAAEFLNTGIEVVVDLASPQTHPLAKVAKDVGAGAVLIAAITAVLVGLLILGPPLWLKVSELFARH
jgi:diacylglycerol kinase (ATP)